MPSPIPRIRILPRLRRRCLRDEFHNLLAKASTVFQIEGSRAREDESYERVGRMVVEQSDVLIAIWDGEPAAGRGGTTQIVKKPWRSTRRFGLAQCVRTEGSLHSPADKSGKRQTRALDELKSILCRALSDREDGENSFNFSHAYFAEKQPNFDPGRIFRIFRDLVAAAALLSIVARSEFREVVAGRMERMIASSPGLPEDARRYLLDRLCPQYGWADGLSTYYGRSSSLDLVGDQPHGCFRCPGSHGGLRLRTARHRPG